MNLSRLHPIESLGNNPAKAGEIRIERLEKRLKPKVAFPHRHDFYHLLFLEKASGWHEIDFNRYKAKSKQIFNVLPGQVHSWSFKTGTKGFVLEFTKESLGNHSHNKELLERLQNVPASFENALTKDLEILLQQLFAEFKNQDTGYNLCLEYLLQTLLLKLTRKQSSIKFRAQSSLIENYRNLIDKNFKTEHTVAFYAKELGLSSKALTTKIASALGKPAGALVQERCLIEAKRLLSYSELSIAEISYSIGYEDPNYFARWFRKSTGLTAGQFRKRALRSVSGPSRR